MFDLATKLTVARRGHSAFTQSQKLRGVVVEDVSLLLMRQERNRSDTFDSNPQMLPATQPGLIRRLVAFQPRINESLQALAESLARVFQLCRARSA